MTSAALVDRYELQELLGTGGMARVHAAVDRRLGRRVAVKLVREDLVGDGRSRQRLLREARSAASFHHPNSVAVFDVGEHDGQPFIVMELIDGESLADRLAREGRLDADETARIGAGVLAALEAAHERGLVHRDIKPANVLLPRGGGVKLADFGIAKAIAETAGGLTAAGDVLGTPSYLSPEQAAGQPALPASDLYALGIVLYECLAGEPPFSGENPLAVALAHQREVVPPLRRVAPDVPADLAEVVAQATAKDPGDRFTDAAAMRRRLEAFAGAATAPTVALGHAPSEVETTVLGRDDEAPTHAATTVLPPETDAHPGPGDGRRPGRRRWWVVLVLLALGLAGMLAAGMLGPGVDDEPEEPPGDEAPADEAPGDAPADEVPPPQDEAPAADEPAPEEDGDDPTGDPDVDTPDDPDVDTPDDPAPEPPPDDPPPVEP